MYVSLHFIGSSTDTNLSEQIDIAHDVIKIRDKIYSHISVNMQIQRLHFQLHFILAISLDFTEDISLCDLTTHLLLFTAHFSLW